MNQLVYVLISLCSLAGLSSCEKDDDGMGINTSFKVEAKPSNDGSGTVSFLARSSGAVNYSFSFGDGQVAETQTGEISHTYTKPGSNTFYVTVKATKTTGEELLKSTPVTVTVSGLPPGVIWADEFNVDGSPNPANWTFEIGTGSNGWGNNELQYYTNRSVNARVENGVLKITARRENFSGSAFTSARLISKNKFDFKYGTVEARAKIPTGIGTWPAIWMLGANIDAVSWPDCGEIDIMEHKGSEPNRIYGTLHYPGRSGGNANGNTINIPTATSAFHLYKVEWTAQQIRIFVDDKLFHSVPNSQAIPFNHNFFLLLNMAMGGTFGGNVDPSFTEATMEIDYIRVSQ